MISKSMIRVSLCVLGIFLVSFGSGSAAPSIFNGKGQTYGGVDAEYQYRTLGGDKDTYSRRFGFTASYGLLRWLDVYARAGVSQLTIDFYGTTNPTDMEGSYKFGGGVGGRIKLLSLRRLVLYAEGQGFIFFSEGDLSQKIADVRMQTNQKWEWREAEGVLGISLNLGKMSIYGGASVSNIQTFTDIKKQRIEDSEEVGDPIMSSEEYTSGPLRDPAFIGAVFDLARDFKLNIKVKGPEEIAVYVGLTQLYKGGPGTF